MTKDKTKLIMLIIGICSLMIAEVSSVDYSLPIAYGRDKYIGCTILNADYVKPNWDRYWNQVTPQYLGKWTSTEPNRDQMSWAGLDFAYNYAKTKGYIFKGHTFVWGQQIPGWIGGLSTTDQAAQVEQWIQLYCQRYPDPQLIDVVNQPLHILPNYIQALGGSGASGWQWVLQAFRLARKHCPNAKLLLNQYDVQIDSSMVQRYLQIIRLLKAENLIDGMGLQAHHGEYASAATIKQNLDTLASVNIPIYISELDLNLGDDTAQLNKLKQLFPVYYQHPAVRGVTFWGYTRGDQWLGNAWLYDANAGGSTGTTSNCPITTIQANIPLSFSFSDTTVSIPKVGKLRVRFANDGTVNSETMQVDYAIIDGIKYQAQAQAVNTAVWQNQCGGSYSQLMHCPGYIEFPIARTSVTVRARAVDKGGEQMTIQILEDCTTTTTTNTTTVALPQERASLRWLKYEYFANGGSTPTTTLPIAAYTFTKTDLKVSFDGSFSTPGSGATSLSLFTWTFSDGTTGSGSKIDHIFTVQGTYNVKLTVMDTNGIVDDQIKTIIVTKPTNVLPVANFNYQANLLSVSFDGSNGISTDTDGTIVSWNWNLGDGTTNVASQFIHSYQNAGTYTVSLTATDNNGGMSTILKQVVVTSAVNMKPVAQFVITSVVGLNVNVDASTSSDSDGTIVEYQWNFGDGNVRTGSKIMTNVYSLAGAYTITLTIKDDKGDTNSTTRQVTVQAINQPPVASFVLVKTIGLVAYFDSTLSSDPQNGVLSYSWVWGDSTPVQVISVKQITHTYSVSGTYNVVLTVKDPLGLTNSITKRIQVQMNSAPVCSFDCSVWYMRVTCTSTSTDDGGVTGYEWNWGDNQLTTAVASTTHDYNAPGPYTIILTARDAQLLSTSCTKPIIVSTQITNIPPVNKWNFWRDNKIVHFYFEGYDADGTIAKYQWSFGDQTTSIESAPAHTYASAGSYVVMLTVTDNSGASVVLTKTVDVILPPLNVHIETMRKYTTGLPLQNALCNVKVFDNYGNPVGKILVTGQVRSPTSNVWQDVSGVTNSSGIVTLKSIATRSNFIFEVCVWSLNQNDSTRNPQLWYNSGQNKLSCV